MDLESLTIRELRELAALAKGLLGGEACSAPNPPADPYLPWVGKAIFIRTVTHHFTGRLVAVYAGELVVEDAAWIADDGRFAQAMETGQFSEVEPYPNGRLVIGRGSIIDVFCYGKDTPRVQK